MASVTAEARSAPEWLHARERGSLPLLRFMIWVALRLGRPIARLLLGPIVLYFLVFSPRSRAAARAFFARVYGHPARARDLWRHYWTFAATILDRVYFLAGRWGEFDIRIHGGEELRRIVARGRGCVLLGSHLGSFEVLRAAAVCGAGWSFSMLMDNANAQKLARTFAAMNPALAATVIESGAPDSLVRAKERVESGALLGVLGDRLRPGDRAVECDFLGARARFPTSPYLIAGVLRAPVVLCFGLYRGARRYDIHFEVFGDPLALPRATRAEAVAALAQAYAARLEHFARLAPDNWFNFFDFWGARGTPAG